MVKAVAVLTGTNGGQGTVHFRADGSGKTTGGGKISGVNSGDYALVIHTYGNISNGGKSTGPPFKLAGDDGVIVNITVDDGTATFNFSEKIPLSGPDSVIGKGLVLHSNRSPNLDDGVVWAVIGLDA